MRKNPSKCHSLYMFYNIFYVVIYLDLYFIFHISS